MGAERSGRCTGSLEVTLVFEMVRRYKIGLLQQVRVKCSYHAVKPAKLKKVMSKS